MRPGALALVLVAAGALAQDGPAPLPAPPPGGETRLLRFPDIHDDVVVFVYGGDLWRAPASGGEAWRLTSHPGLELFPKISPDGQWIAYTGEYSGTRQVYVLPVWGGEPRQLTFYADVGPMPPRGGWDAWIQDWMPDGKILVRMNRTPWGERMGRYYLVDPRGGLEVPLPIPHGGSASPSPDGGRLAYTPIDREFRTWKRTRGGRAQDVWIYDLQAHRSERVTDHPGTDNFPMWVGRTIYFTSDREDALNLYAYDLDARATRKVTDFEGSDVLWPSTGPGAIVFQNEGRLVRLDLASGQTRAIPIHVPSDRALAVPHFRNVRDRIASFELSPAGSRALFEARGEIFTAPAKHGTVRNLTRTQGVREMSPTWSPDGTRIAYLSDATGEYEIWLRSPDGTGEPRRVTSDGTVWRYAPTWSPDSRKLAFGDRRQRLFIVDVASGRLTEVDRGEQEDLVVHAWSPDSRWLAYEKSHPSRLGALMVHSTESGRSFRLGDGLTDDRSPVFSADGRYLFFLSNRDFQPTFSAFEFNYVYTHASRIYVASLAQDTPALFPIRSDEDTTGAQKSEVTSPEDEFEIEPKRRKGRRGEPDEEDEEDEDQRGATRSDPPRDEPDDAGGTDEPGATKEKPVPRVRIEPDGFVERTTSVPGIEAGEYSSLAATAKALFYFRAKLGEQPTLYRYDIEERKEEKILSDVQAYALSADGAKLLYRSNTTYGIVDAKAGQKQGDGALDLSGMTVKIDPRAEWRQMFDDAWRIARDWFYDPRMHGMDWKALGERYRALVPHLAHRGDLDFILGEMLSELEAGHTYVAAGDEPRIERVRGGMLGCELEADGASGRYRIARIYPGENWDPEFRSPLTEPGVDVGVGDFLLAIDGQELRTNDNPYRLLENTADRPVVLTVSSAPSGRRTRTVTVRPVASELGLRYLAWVRERMELAERLSGGRVGYIHLPDTALDGNRMLQKLFYSQSNKPALVIDDRYNGGGFIPDRMIEVLSRETLAYWARRGIESMRTPGFAHDGPKAMLVNGYSSSGGDALPYFFRLRQLGRIFGTRTWGGLIGLSGNPQLVDGGAVQIPTFRIYDRSGRWVVENEGVSPDVEVIDLPEAVRAGNDPTLEAAVAWLVEQLETAPARPAPPPPPDLTGSDDGTATGAGRP